MNTKQSIHHIDRYFKAVENGDALVQQIEFTTLLPHLEHKELKALLEQTLEIQEREYHATQ